MTKEKGSASERPCLTCPNSMQGDKRPGDEECNNCIPYKRWRNEYPCRECGNAVNGHRDDSNKDVCHPCQSHREWFRRDTTLLILHDKQRSHIRQDCCAI